jgi:hypothetical protein
MFTSLEGAYELTQPAHRSCEPTPLLPGAAPIAFRPPEVVMHELSNGNAGSLWSQAGDIWAIGSTVSASNSNTHD